MSLKIMYVYFTAALVDHRKSAPTLAFEAENETEAHLLDAIRQVVKDAGGLSLRPPDFSTDNDTSETGDEQSDPSG